MAARTNSKQDHLLSCQTCLTEIPPSVANSLEGKDYVHYFCGADCFALWEELHDDEELGE